MEIHRLAKKYRKSRPSDFPKKQFDKPEPFVFKLPDTIKISKKHMDRLAESTGESYTVYIRRRDWKGHKIVMLEWGGILFFRVSDTVPHRSNPNLIGIKGNKVTLEDLNEEELAGLGMTVV